MIVLIKELELDMNELSTSEFLKFYPFKFKTYGNIIKSEIITKIKVNIFGVDVTQYNLLMNIQYIVSTGGILTNYSSKYISQIFNTFSNAQ